ncbi:MAG: Gfo/Idh/MocA family protein [Elusimicrobiota bacterium]
MGSFSPSISTSEMVGVIGTGSIGTRHLEILKSFEKIRPVCFSKRASRKKELFAQGYSIVDSVLEMKKLGVKAAIIATDTKEHFRYVEECLEAGMDVLVEKPLAIDAKEAKKIAQLSEKLSRKVYVGCVMRFSLSLREFIRCLKEMGKIYSVRVECQSYLPAWRPERNYKEAYSARKEEGGVLRDLVHEIDYTGWIFGWPDSLQAHLGNTGVLGIESEEFADISWNISPYTSVSMRLDYLSNPPRRGIIVTGEKGVLEWDGIKNSVCFTSNEGRNEWESGENQNAKYEMQLNSFCEAVFSGKTSGLLATVVDGVKAMLVIEAARLASMNKKEMEISY